jgi:hypothetical protein
MKTVAAWWNVACLEAVGGVHAGGDVDVQRQLFAAVYDSNGTATLPTPP